MSRLVTCGWETGSLGQVDVVNGTPAVSNVRARTGSYSFYVTGTSKNCCWFFPSTDVFYLRFAVYPISFTRSTIFRLKDIANNHQIYLAHTDGLLRVGRGDSTFLAYGNGSQILHLNAWHCIEVYGFVDNANGRIVVKLNGVTQIDFTGDTQATANAEVSKLFIPSDSSGLDGYYDDIALNDDAGAVNNSWVGRGGIYPGVVDGAGDNTDLTPSAGNNYECVDERPPNDDTDYVSSDVVDDYDLYTIAATGAPGTGDVSDVVLWARARLAEVGAGNIATVIKPNAAETDSSDYGLDVSYSYVKTHYEQNPETAAAWSVAEVDATQIGVKVR